MPGRDELLKDFAGVVPLFPLPNLVHFPHVIQGLHIFEPRYRQLMADALAGNMMFALVMLKPGWEKDYENKPAIENVACLGKIGQWEKLIDGRYNLQLHGLARIRLLAELETDKLYRIAQAEILPEFAPDDLPTLKRLREELGAAVLPRFTPGSEVQRQVEELIHGDLPLGALCDLLAYALPLPLDLKQQLLAEPNAAIRCTVLTHALHVRQAAAQRKFPPDFSTN